MLTGHDFTASSDDGSGNGKDGGENYENRESGMPGDGSGDANGKDGSGADEFGDELGNDGDGNGNLDLDDGEIMSICRRN